LEIVRVDSGVDDERLEVGGAEGGGEAEEAEGRTEGFSFVRGLEEKDFGTAVG
jgi:hypothetical protein